MKISQRMKAKRKVYRAGLFCLITLIPVCFEAFFLYYFKVPMWANMLILIVTLLGLYFLYVFVCEKIDKRKEEKEKERKTKDPFAD